MTGNSIADISSAVLVHYIIMVRNNCFYIDMVIHIYYN